MTILLFTVSGLGGDWFKLATRFKAYFTHVTSEGENSKKKKKKHFKIISVIS